MAIDTLGNVKTSLGIVGSDDDSLLSILRDAADSFVSEYCGRSFEVATYLEHHSGGGKLVFLKNYPVESILSLQVDPAELFGAATTIATSAYTLHAERGVIESRSDSFVPARPGFRVRADDFPRSVRVEYTTASSATPAAVRRAYAELIGHWYRQTKSHQGLNHLDLLSRPSGNGFESFPYGLSGGFKLPSNVLQVLNLFRVPAA